MAVFGIVSEFNPFHKGHKYLVECARELGATSVVSVMSGNATQRGELSCIDKYKRAECAVRCGVDLVLELPYPFSSASAEFFARGAISVLSQICDTIIFGSECGDVEVLRRAAEFAAKDEFKSAFGDALRAGEQSATAYLSLIERQIGIKLSSNDILGVEYIKAAHHLGANLDFVTVKRIGATYLERDARTDALPDSAMSIRAMMATGDVDSLKERLPEPTLEVINHSLLSGEYINDDKYLDAARLYFRLTAPENIASFVGLEGGVAERICRAAHESRSGMDFFDRILTKRYTDARLRRSILFAMTGVLPDDLSGKPAYTTLLAADELGRELLSAIRKADKLTVVTKPADAAELEGDAAKRQCALASRLDTIYSYSLECSAASGEQIKKKPYIT